MARLQITKMSASIKIYVVVDPRIQMAYYTSKHKVDPDSYQPAYTCVILTSHP
jgi:hypothetical protein